MQLFSFIKFSFPNTVKIRYYYQMMHFFRTRSNTTIKAILTIWLILGFALTPVLDAANDLHTIEHGVTTAEHHSDHAKGGGIAEDLAELDSSNTGTWHELMHSSNISAQSTAALNESFVVPVIKHVHIVFPHIDIHSPTTFRQNLFRPPIA